MCCFTIGNIYKDSISDIIKSYDPYSIPPMDALLRGGLKELIRYAKSIGIRVDAARHYSACGICSEIVRSFRKQGYREKMEKPTVLPK